MKLLSRMSSSRRRAAGVLMASAAVAALMTAGAAGTASAAPQTTRSVETAMTIGGYDPAVAEAHGYEIRTTTSGLQYSVKKGTAPSEVSTQDIVHGNCGSSWVYETAQGGLRVWLETGFNVIAPVTQSSWNVTLVDRGGRSNQPYPSWTGGPYWASNRYAGGLTAGPASATVNPGSFAVLTTGAICYSGSPRATTTIY